MSGKKTVVPEGMLKAAKYAVADVLSARPRSIAVTDPLTNREEIALEATLRWLDEELEAMLNSKPPEHSVKFREAIFDVLRMFVAPEPEVPEEIKDLLVQHEDQTLRCTIYDANQRLIEAFRRGQKSRETA